MNWNKSYFPQGHPKGPFHLFVYGIFREPRLAAKDLLGHGAARRATAVRTYSMYTMRSWGCAHIHTGGKDSMLGDVWEVPNEDVIKGIHGLEFGAGYTFGPIKIRDFKNCWAYFGRHEGGGDIIPSGDWIRERR